MLLYYTICPHGSAQFDSALQVMYKNNKKESPSVLLKESLYRCTALHTNAQLELRNAPKI